MVHRDPIPPERRRAPDACFIETPFDSPLHYIARPTPFPKRQGVPPKLRHCASLIAIRRRLRDNPQGSRSAVRFLRHHVPVLFPAAAPGRFFGLSGAPFDHFLAIPAVLVAVRSFRPHRPGGDVVAGLELRVAWQLRRAEKNVAVGG